MYDLKQGRVAFSGLPSYTKSFAEITKSPISKVPPELARHEAAQQKVSKEMKRKRDEDQG
jgi:hypothetical protein